MKKKNKKSNKEKPVKKILVERKIEEQQYVDAQTEPEDDAEPGYPFDEKLCANGGEENKQ